MSRYHLIFKVLTTSVLEIYDVVATMDIKSSAIILKCTKVFIYTW